MQWKSMFAPTARKLINCGYFLLILSAVAAIDHWWPLTVLAIVGWIGWLIPAAFWFSRRRSFQLLRRRPSNDRPWGSPPPTRKRNDDPDR